MIGIVADIETAMNASAFPATVHYGRPDAEEIQKAALDASGVKRYFIVDTMDPKADFVLSGGNLHSLSCVFAVVSTTRKLAVSYLHDWLVGIGYENENNTIGIPASAPWTFQTLQLFSLDLVGGLTMSAEKLGAYWIAPQVADLVVRKP